MRLLKKKTKHIVTIELEDNKAKNIVKDTIHANGIDIGIYTQDFQNEFISLMDIARYKSDEAKDVIKNWMRSKDTIEFLGLWEKLHNNNFKGVEFDSFRNQAGLSAIYGRPLLRSPFQSWSGKCLPGRRSPKGWILCQSG